MRRTSARRLELLRISMAVLAAAVAPGAILAQTTPLTLYSVSGTAETPVGMVFNFGTVAAGAIQNVHFRARNTGNTVVALTTLAPLAATDGFAITNSPSLPYNIAGGNSLPFDFTVQFGPEPPGTYNATLQLNTLGVTLVATVVPSPSLSAAAPCTGPDATGLISFGRTQEGSRTTCTLSLTNSYAQALTESPFTLNSNVFQASSPVGATLTLAPQQTVTFPVTFLPPGSIAYSATLTVGSQTFTLSGTGYPIPLPAPMMIFDSTAIRSGEQHTLTLRLPTPALAQASGLLTLAFTPSTSAVADDTSIVFVATNSRVISFAINQGSTDVQLNNQPNVIFQTGTTAGTLTFTVNPGGFGVGGSYPPATLTIAPAPASIETSTATERANELDITILGFDNSYTAGEMSFTFYNTSGRPIGGPIQADFTKNFAAYYQTQPPSGSSFLLRLSFPVTGDVTQVGSVNVTMANAAGSVQPSPLTFP